MKAITRDGQEMKYSGIEWIGEVPSTWRVCKTLYGLSMPITDGPHTTPELYAEGVPFVSAEAVSTGNGSIDFSHIRGYVSEEFYQECSKKYIPQREDIYMIKSGATTGKVSIVDTDRKFTIWSPLAVFRVNNERIISKYLFYYIQSEAYQKQVELNWSYGTQQNIGMRVLEQLKICMPVLDEQKNIANYLDDRCSKIDAIIDEAKASIEEYKELKQAVIYEAVTKGLDKNVEMKDSGVPFVGFIPYTWKVGKLKNIVKISDGTHDTPEYVNENNSYPLVTSKCIVDGKIDVSLAGRISENDYIEINKRSKVNINDVIMPMIGTVGNPAIVLDSDKFAIKNVALIKTNGNYYLGRFIQYLLNSNVFIQQYDSMRRGGVQDFISQDKLKNIVIAIPNSYIEIVDYLDIHIAKVDELIYEKQSLIEDLESYKKSLIYEVVTGKRKVVE